MTRPPYATRGVAAVVAVQALLLLGIANRYGPHRDELYFSSAGQHLAWGYADQPSFTPLLAAISHAIAPDSLLVLRIWSIVAVAVIVVLSAQFARLLGGGRSAQLLTAVAVAAGVCIMAVGHRLSTATFDTLAWTAVVLVVTQALVDDRPRLWLWAGLIAGIGLNNKHGVAFCLFGVLVGVALVRETRPVLRTRWPWLGGVVALLLWIPNLLWQHAHDWPVLDLSADISEEYGGVGGRIELLGQALIMFSPVIGALWIFGIVELLRRPAWVRARPVAVGFLAILLVFVVTGGKGYYLAGLVVPLVAAGSVALAERWPGRRTAVAGAVLALSAVVAWPAVIPVLPEQTYVDSYPKLDVDQLETIGWDDHAETVRAVVADLPDGAVVFTGNYGEAGAMEWYDVGAPVYSGHNGWREWGPPPESASPVVVVGWDVEPEEFEGCERAATLHNDAGADNEEEGAGVWVCDGPVGSWSERWPDLVHYDA
ncbi:glycosyltransferase family 39 protein [Nocardioides sp. SR21]|uniref:glycosyltransferase family 39 protein n=1 Tax=Nocardioides sp. SR21 TaxID=2919501 RepID=UPI001FAAE601|nr:glycosyltransferase family 39 protein [Nocardioides sp. SR21]